MTLSEQQKELIVKNEKLVKKFVHKYFPGELWDSKQDLISEGSAIICDRINTFDPEKGAYSTWVFQVLGYCLRNVHNKKRYDDSVFNIHISSKEMPGNNSYGGSGEAPYCNVREISPETRSDNVAGLNDLEYMMELDNLSECLKQLDPIDQTILHMHYNHASTAEILKATGLSYHNQLYYRKKMAMIKLKKLLNI